MTTPDVDKQSLAVAAQAVHWPMIDALVGGTQAMRAAATTFLPKWPQESKESYDDRLKSATLFPAFSHTTMVMAAKPFARPMAVDENTIAPRIKPWLVDVDMFGTDLQPFAADLMLACMQKGVIGVLVDVPKAEGVRTLADERARGVRPYLTKYPAESILGWRAVRDANGSHLAQIRLKEQILEPDGLWGDKIVDQVRVLTPGVWQIYRKRAATDAASGTEWSLYEEGTTSLKKVPFVFFYGLRKDFGLGAPPMLDLAYMNVEHWQSSSDQQTILHVARVPILFAKGFGETDQLTIGASSAARASAPDSDLRFVEHTGAAIEAGRQSILDLEDRMRQTGAELLIQQAATSTATQVTSESEAGRTKLQKIVEDFEESLESCLQLMGEWVSEKSDPEVEIYKDFGAANLSEKGGDLLLRAAADRHVSSETVFGALKRMDVVPADLAWQDEKLKIPPPEAPVLASKPKKPKAAKAPAPSA